MNARIEQGLQRLWATRGPWVTALLPLAALYGWLWRRRAAAATQPGYRAERFPVPVVVVGNVVVGGAGKTPVTMALVRDLQAHGWRPGVVSRGYGRRSAETLPVTATSDPTQVGDEPLLIAQTTGVPVYVGARRADAARALLAAHANVNLIVCDDGLQHLALARDVEVVVFDERGTGNGCLLPAGPLREPWPRPAQGIPEIVVHTTARSLNAQVLGQLPPQPVAALAGIARPEAFFDLLRRQGVALSTTLALPDHADLARQWPVLRARLRQAPLWLCTEKDAVKLRPLLGAGDPLIQAVPLEVALPADFFAAVRRALSSTLNTDNH